MLDKVGSFISRTALAVRQRMEERAAQTWEQYSITSESDLGLRDGEKPMEVRCTGFVNSGEENYLEADFAILRMMVKY